MATKTARKPTLTPEERAERVEALNAELVTAVEQLTDSASWRAMLEVSARFPQYSFNNQLLLWAQAEARGVVLTRVAAFGTWLALGYRVTAGSKAFKIFEPIKMVLRADEIAEWLAEGCNPFASDGKPRRVVRGFKVGSRFDVSQVEATEDAQPLPEQRGWISQAGNGPDGLWSSLVATTTAAGFTMDVRPAVSADGGAHGRTNYETRVVWVNSECDEAERIRILAHETCGHIRCDHERRRDVSRQQRETEADSVAFVVLSALGFDISSSSVEYVAGWSDGKAEVLQEAAETVRRVAVAVLGELEGQS
jgi:N-terminal domain of anti-restriction factor ArdC